MKRKFRAMFTHAIVGLGPAGILTLACLPKDVLKTTVVIEPSAVGGSLSTEYGSVIANIPKSVILDAFRKVPDWTLFPMLDGYSDNDCPRLADVCRQMRALIADTLALVTHRTKQMTTIQAHGVGWRIEMGAEMLEAQNVFLCTGTKPKTLDLPIPHIPLHVALNPSMLGNYITSTESVVLFGLSHSGTLILKNLKSIGCTKVTALYKGEKPFRYARDGDTEGIKQESAAIADEITAGAWGLHTPKLLCYDDFSAAYRAVSNATIAIYAIGFDKPKLEYKTESGEIKPLIHIPETSRFEGVSNLWGFGIGFPSLYTAPNGRQYPDVGFGGFIDSIKASLPA